MYINLSLFFYYNLILYNNYYIIITYVNFTSCKELNYYMKKVNN